MRTVPTMIVSSVSQIKIIVYLLYTAHNIKYQ